MTDFTFKIKTESDYKAYFDNASDKDINRVLIFTYNVEISTLIKAISAEFRDTLRVCVF